MSYFIYFFFHDLQSFKKIEFVRGILYCDVNDVHSMVDKKANYVLNKSECYKGFQEERKSVHMSTTEISENKVQQQTNLDIDATNLDMVAPTDLGKSTKEDHLQYRPNMSIKAWQDHEVPRPLSSTQTE